MLPQIFTLFTKKIIPPPKKTHLSEMDNKLSEIGKKNSADWSTFATNKIQSP